MSITQNYQTIIKDIRETALKHKRDPDDIILVAVTKGHSLEEIMPLYDLGHRDFGENRLQEALPKIEQAPSDIRWHMIGTLQKNKVRKALEEFEFIESVDTPELAEKISQCAKELSITARILLQVNTSGEISKQGLSRDEWRGVILHVAGLPSIKVEGFMTMAPYTADVGVIRNCFSSLREFREELEDSSGLVLPQLSMGMTHDYRIAIAEGATILRIGTALFQH